MGGFLINFITLIVGFGYPGRMRGGEHLGRSARETEDAHDRRHHLVPDEPSLASLTDELLAARPPFPPSLGLIEDWVSVHPRLLPLSSSVILDACPRLGFLMPTGLRGMPGNVPGYRVFDRVPV